MHQVQYNDPEQQTAQTDTANHPVIHLFRHRQHCAVTDPQSCLELARPIVAAKIRSQCAAARHFQRHEAGHIGSAMRKLGALARRRLTRGQELLARCEPSAVKPCVLMMAVYGRLLRRLEDRGWDKPEVPVRVPALEKAWIALRHGLF